MRKAGKIVLMVAVALMVARIAAAANYRTSLAGELRQLATAIAFYQAEHKRFPTNDICDAQGKPLLSWRIRLLPYLETGNLYNEFRLNEPWDSVHNRQLIGKIPPMYNDAYRSNDENDGKTRVVALRGPKTFFGTGKPRRLEEIGNNLATTAILVEAAPEHAVIWTKPEDLPYDPAVPGRGLARTWQTGFFRERGAFVVLADDSVRVVRESADPDMLRWLFSIDEGQPVQLELPWYAVLDKQPLGGFIVASLLMSMPFIAGSLAVSCRFVRGTPTSPGEVLLFVIGLQQLVFVLSFVAFYRYEVLPTLFQGGHSEQAFWLLAYPAAAGIFGSLLAFIRFWSVPSVRAIFGVLLVLSALCYLDSRDGHQHWQPEEALTLIGHPWTFAIAALALLCATRLDLRVKNVRPRWNLFCLLLATVPLAWFAFWCAYGVAVQREVFMRTLD